MPTAKEIEHLNPEELARLAGNGSDECFTELANRFSGPLKRFLARKVANRADVDDLAQEVFVRVHRAMHKFNPERRFASWFFTVAGRVACSHGRKMSPVPEADVETADPANPAVIVSAREEQEGLWETIDCLLPESQSAALRMRYEAGMSVREISRATGKTGIHVRVLLHRARLKLAECLPSDMTGGRRREESESPQ